SFSSSPLYTRRRHGRRRAERDSEHQAESPSPNLRTRAILLSFHDPFAWPLQPIARGLASRLGALRCRKATAAIPPGACLGRSRRRSAGATSAPPPWDCRGLNEEGGAECREPWRAADGGLIRPGLARRSV